MDSVTPKKKVKLAFEKKISREEAEEAVRTLIKWAGDNPKREGLLDTPKRVVKALLKTDLQHHTQLLHIKLIIVAILVFLLKPYQCKKCGQSFAENEFITLHSAAEHKTDNCGHFDILVKAISVQKVWLKLCRKRICNITLSCCT